MSKRKYTVEEAAEFILSDVPLDNTIDTDIEYDSDEVDASVSEVARLPHEESFSEYVDSSSEEECPAEYEEQFIEDESSSVIRSSNRSHDVDNTDNTLDLMENPITPIQDYNVDQTRAWQKKEKVELDVTFDLPQGPVMDHFADCSSEGDFFFEVH